MTFKLILILASIFSGVDCLSIVAISAGCERDDGVPWLAPHIIARLAHVEPTLLDIAYLTIHVDARALAFTRCKNLPPRHLLPRHFGETRKTHNTT